MKSVKFTSIPKINTVMGMTKEEYKAFSEARLSSHRFDDKSFSKLPETSSKMEDNYVWSTCGQCWLPKY